MQLSEIQQIAEIAEKACAAAANHPKNTDLREDLFELLGPVAKLAILASSVIPLGLSDIGDQSGYYPSSLQRRLEAEVAVPIYR